MLQQPTEFRLALDSTLRERDRHRFFTRSRRQCPIIQALVRPKLVVKPDIDFDNVPQMIDAQAHEMVEALNADCLHKAFCERIPLRDLMHRLPTMATELFE